MVVFLSSCSKDPEKTKDEPKTAQPAQVQSRENSTSLFGNNHIVPAYVARAVAKKINLTVSEVMRVGSSTSVRTVDSLFTISDSLGIRNGWFYYNSWNSSLGNYQYAQNFTHNIQP
ncbi:MAG: hypothetical protein RIR11_4016 [Bacteroidota bacterium]